MALNKPNNDGPQIAAKHKGPGPAKYGLPGTIGYTRHDVTKRKSPAFSFGMRFVVKAENSSPGPCYKVPQFITRKGKDTSPAYSLYGRQIDLKAAKCPSPGEYSPEKYPIPHAKKGPSYSFGKRLMFEKSSISPAPNAYSLPSLTGPNCTAKRSAPAHSLVGRPKLGGCYEDLQQTPGPGTYKVTKTNAFLSRGPAYSIKGRHFPPQDNTVTPGPGSYSPEKVSIHRPSPPKFSFGVRHTEYVAPMKVDRGDTKQQFITLVA